MGGIREIVSADREALLVPPGRPDELAAALTRVLRDDALRSRLAAGAAATGAQLGVERAIRRTETLYAEVCA